jgi:acyl-coenzyme A thioesterase PaaI-like protein
VSSPGPLTGSAESRVRASFSAQTMLATLGASIVEIAPGRLLAAMQATTMAVAAPPATPDVPAT